MSDYTSTVFQRLDHNKENPFALTSRALIRDETISPECRWLLIYLLSMKDDFKINVKQIWNHVKEFIGRDKVLRIIDEAWSAGYMKREDRYVGNLRRGVTYYVSESPVEEFKKCFRRPDPQFTGGQVALSNSLCKDILPVEDIERNSDIKKEVAVPSLSSPAEKKKKPPKLQMSQEEKDLLSQMLEFKPPVGDSLEASFITAMFKKHGYERVKKAFDFCSSKEIKSSIGGLLRKSIENEWEVPNDEFNENKRICEEFASKHPSRFNVTKAYLTCPEIGIDIDFKRPREHVLEQLEKIGKRLNIKGNHHQECDDVDLGEFDL